MNSENISKGMKKDKPWIYAIRVNFFDGTARYPVMVSESDEDYAAQLDEAEGYFNTIYKGKGTLTVHYAEDPYLAGVNDIENLLSWKDFKKRHQIR